MTNVVMTTNGGNAQETGFAKSVWRRQVNRPGRPSPDIHAMCGEGPEADLKTSGEALLRVVAAAFAARITKLKFG